MLGGRHSCIYHTAQSSYALKSLNYSITISFLVCLHKYSVICIGLSRLIKCFKVNLKHWPLLELSLNNIYIVDTV
jgi:hypothetical protein